MATMESKRRQEVERVASNDDVAPWSRLRIIRRLLGLTQAEVGAAANVDQAQVSRWESGKAQPSNIQCWQLKNLTGIPVDHWAEWWLRRAGEGGEAA